MVDDFVKLCTKAKQKNQNRILQTIENNYEYDEKTVNNVDKNNTRYEFDYSSSYDNCVAMNSNDHSDKIASQNVNMMIGNNQVTLLLDSGSVCSIVTKDLATSIINNCKEAKWGSEKGRTFQKNP